MSHLSQVTNTPRQPRLTRGQVADGIHGLVVVAVCVMATVYASITKDHSNNIWIVYGSSIAYAAGRSGISVATSLAAERRNVGNPPE